MKPASSEARKTIPLAMSVEHAEPADRVRRECHVARCLGVVAAVVAGARGKGLLAHVGLDHTGMDRIDPDPVSFAGEFERGRFGEQVTPPFVIE